MGMTIEGEGQTEQLRRNYDRSRPHSSLVYTPRAMGLLKGARYLLLDDDLTQAAYIKMKNETEEMLASGYSPEFDDTLETGKLLRDFGNLLRGTSVAHLNWLLRTMLNVVYVYPWWKEVSVWRRRMPSTSPFRPWRVGSRWPCSTAQAGVQEGVVETGESRTPRPEEPIIRMYYKLVRRFVLGLFRYRRHDLERPSRFIFGRHYRHQAGRIPDLWRLHPLIRE